MSGPRHIREEIGYPARIPEEEVLINAILAQLPECEFNALQPHLRL
jgi:hypothetical protein